jgi:hypothetical protein
MKFNWGHGLALGMIGFIIYIMFMVVQALNMDFDLETENYYAKELKYQETIDKAKNYQALDNELLLELNSNSILVTYPMPSIDSGKVLLFRPSDKKMDQVYTVKPDGNGTQNLAIENPQPGRYKVQIEWWSSGTGYFFEKDIVL